jgi:hypothetical protein
MKHGGWHHLVQVSHTQHGADVFLVIGGMLVLAWIIGMISSRARG